jgi:pyruvate kinase
LGVRAPAENVPRIQKDIICHLPLGKPVVVATQMLESMRFPAPTRAEESH